MEYIDMHCDTLVGCVLSGKYNNIYEIKEGMLDLKRMREASQLCQFFAVFFPPRNTVENGWDNKPENVLSDEQLFDNAVKILDNTIENYGDIIGMAHNYTEIIKNRENKKISSILTMEDGRAVNGSLDKLDYFYNRGVRLITLTWNHENCFGSPNSDDFSVMNRGLTDFGKEAVEYMNLKGMAVDVSHLSDGGFYDVAEISKKPFFATHSNCRSVCSNKRNLTDDMIKIMGEKGCVAGINFYPGFLEENTDVSRVSAMIEHIKHFVNTGGEDIIGLGSDFDGISGNLQVGNPLEIHKIFDAMKKAGFTERQIDKFATENVLRVIRDTIK